MLGETKAGRAEGAPQTGPLTRSLAWQGQTGPDRQHRVCSTPPPPPLLLSATQTPGADRETEEGGRRNRRRGRGGKRATEHNEETDTEYPNPLAPQPSIRLWVKICIPCGPVGRLLPCPLPCLTPVLPPSPHSSDGHTVPTLLRPTTPLLAISTLISPWILFIC